MTLRFDIVGAQIQGERDYQEDAFLINHSTSPDLKTPDYALVVVADGIGGHAAGNIASKFAVQHFCKYFSEHFPSEDLLSLLHASLEEANNSILEMTEKMPVLKGMGCTLVALLLTQQGAYWISVGDSHLYILHGNLELEKLNEDHSYGGYIDKIAAMGGEVEHFGYPRNMLLSALTGDPLEEIDCSETAYEIRPGDRLIIASDGLNTLTTGKLRGITSRSKTAKECTENLLEGVTAARLLHQDNTTVVVAEVVSLL
jgi:protein phosphatase